jgi:hypothetical protein
VQKIRAAQKRTFHMMGGGGRPANSALSVILGHDFSLSYFNKAATQTAPRQIVRAGCFLRGSPLSLRAVSEASETRNPATNVTASLTRNPADRGICATRHAHTSLMLWGSGSEAGMTTCATTLTSVIAGSDRRERDPQSRHQRHCGLDPQSRRQRYLRNATRSYVPYATGFRLGGRNDTTI